MIKKHIVIIAIIAIAVILLTQPVYAENNLADKLAKLFNRVEVLERKVDNILSGNVTTNKAPPVQSVSSVFSGQGNTYTLPFTVTSYPWTIEWSAEMLIRGGVNFDIEIFDATKTTQNRVKSLGFYISGNTTGGTAVYVLPGQYYMYINAAYFIKWTVKVGNLW